MDGFPQETLPHVAKCACLLLLATAVLGVLLRRGLAGAPRLCRWMALLLLLQSWVFFSVPVVIACKIPGIAASRAPGERMGNRGDALGTTGSMKTSMPVLHGDTVWKLAAVIWLAGIGLVTATAMVNYGRFVLVLRRARVAPPGWQREWRTIAGEAGKRVPVLRLSQAGPLLCLLPGRYALLVPDDFHRTLSAPERAALLRHEYAHLSRGDCWKSTLVALLALPQWFNPAAWRLVRLFRDAAEWSCDDFAARTAGARQALVQGIGLVAVRSNGLFSASHGSADHPVVARIRRLVQPTRPSRRALRLACVCAVLLAGLANTVDVQVIARDAGDNHGSMPGTVLAVDDASLSLRDPFGARLRFVLDGRGKERGLQPGRISPGDQLEIHWVQDGGERVAIDASGEGEFIGTVLGVGEAALEVAATTTNRIERLTPHWLGAMDGGPDPAALAWIRASRPGDSVRVRWDFEERKRLTSLMRLPAN